MVTLEVNEPLVLYKVDFINDWYRLERQGRRTRPRYTPEAALTDAPVEGEAREMRQLAAAILARGSYVGRHNRCQVRVLDRRVLLWSPEVSTQVASVPRAYADQLARQIQAVLGVPGAPVRARAARRS